MGERVTNIHTSFQTFVFIIFVDFKKRYNWSIIYISSRFSRNINIDTYMYRMRFTQAVRHRHRRREMRYKLELYTLWSCANWVIRLPLWIILRDGDMRMLKTKFCLWGAFIQRIGYDLSWCETLSNSSRI